MRVVRGVPGDTAKDILFFEAGQVQDSRLDGSAGLTKATWPLQSRIFIHGNCWPYGTGRFFV